MTALRKRTPEPMTVPAFLDWAAADRTGRSWQLIDAEPLAMAPGSRTHAALQNEIGALLRNHLLDRGSLCQALTEPGIVPLAGANRNYRVPDIGVTCAPLSESLIVPDPVLLIEILSPTPLAALYRTTVLVAG